MGHHAHGAKHRPADPRFAGRRTHCIHHGPWRYAPCLFAAGFNARVLRVWLQSIRPRRTLADSRLCLSDLDLGMNLWMTEPFQYPTEPMDRGKVLSAEDLTRIAQWARYRDVDGDGIPYRTLPGNSHPRSAYLSRGTGHNEFALYSERPADWQANLDRLTRKHDTARTLVPKPIVDEIEGAQIGIITYGSNDPAIREARDQLREQGIMTSYLRLRALPLEATARAFIEKYDRIYVAELNQDGQMHQLLQLHVPERAAHLRSVRICNGLPMSAKFVVDSIREDTNSD